MMKTPIIFFYFRLLAVFVLLQKASYFSLAQCPPSGYDAVKDFDLDKYVNSKNWYALKLVEVSYQPREELYCVFARYNQDGTSNFCQLFGWLFDCYDPLTISIFNYSRRGSTSGRVSSINQLEAIIPDPENDPAKADVGFEFIPKYFRGSPTDYWVVAVGTYNLLPGLETYQSSTDQYEWAIVTSGQPESDGDIPGLCYSANGFWIFSRLPSPPSGALLAIEAIATGLGLDTSVLVTVDHDGCNYGGSSNIFDTTIIFFQRLFDRFF